MTPNRPISDDHFTVDGTLVQRWASLKGFVPKEAPDVDCAPDQPPQAETTADMGQKAESTAMTSPAAEPQPGGGLPSGKAGNRDARLDCRSRGAFSDSPIVRLVGCRKYGTQPRCTRGVFPRPTPRRPDGAREDQSPSGPETAS